MYKGDSTVVVSGTELWTKCLEYLQGHDAISASDFSSWVCPLQAQLTASKLLIIAPNQIVFDQFDLKILPILESHLKEHYPQLVSEIKLSISVALDFEQELPADNENMHLHSNVDDLELNPQYTFSSFVIGKSNQMAEAAAELVAQTPGKTYNPLFIYGGVGLGKTHLMNAIGNIIIDKQHNVKLMYAPAEQFTNEFVYTWADINESLFSLSLTLCNGHLSLSTFTPLTKVVIVNLGSPLGI